MIHGDLNTDEIKAKLAIADDLTRQGRIFDAPQDVLEVALLGLCDQRVDTTHVVKEINKGILFTAILMERRNQTTNKLIIVLAVVAIVVGVVDALIGLAGLCR